MKTITCPNCGAVHCVDKITKTVYFFTCPVCGAVADWLDAKEVA